MEIHPHHQKRRKVLGVSHSLDDILIKTKELQEELKSANQSILDQQPSVIEEKRLRLLFRMIGEAGHEMGQPLMALLGTLSLMRLKRNDPEKLADYIDRIEGFGYRLSDILKKIQTIRHQENKFDFSDISLAKIADKITILVVKGSNPDFETLREVLSGHPGVSFFPVASTESAMEALVGGRFDLILLDHRLASENGCDFFHQLQTAGIELPVIVFGGCGDESAVSRCIRCGASGRLSTGEICHENVERVIASSLLMNRSIKDIKSLSRDQAKHLFQSRLNPA